jgi:hypothetical protein
MPANERQIGGSHYGSGEYQHWDWVADVRMPYHPATAAKYIYRWREKNGIVDLEKAAHYLEKTIELDINYEVPRYGDIPVIWDSFWKLIAARQYTQDEILTLAYIQRGLWLEALNGVNHLLNKTSSEGLQA